MKDQVRPGEQTAARYSFLREGLFNSVGEIFAGTTKRSAVYRVGGQSFNLFFETPADPCNWQAVFGMSRGVEVLTYRIGRTGQVIKEGTVVGDSRGPDGSFELLGFSANSGKLANLSAPLTVGADELSDVSQVLENVLRPSTPGSIRETTRKVKELMTQFAIDTGARKPVVLPARRSRWRSVLESGRAGLAKLQR